MVLVNRRLETLFYSPGAMSVSNEDLVALAVAAFPNSGRWLVLAIEVPNRIGVHHDFSLVRC